VQTRIRRFARTTSIQAGVMAQDETGKQLLHLVFGGELSSLEKLHFRDLESLDLVGIFPDYKSAEAAWRSKAQETVDNAHMRYFIVHLHRLLDPEENGKG
jgi:hypothetical protein